MFENYDIKDVYIMTHAGNKSLREIAKPIMLSHVAVSNRLKRLVELGFLELTAVSNRRNYKLTDKGKKAVKVLGE